MNAAPAPAPRTRRAALRLSTRRIATVRLERLHEVANEAALYVAGTLPTVRPGALDDARTCHCGRRSLRGQAVCIMHVGDAAPADDDGVREECAQLSEYLDGLRDERVLAMAGAL